MKRQARFAVALSSMVLLTGAVPASGQYVRWLDFVGSALPGTEPDLTFCCDIAESSAVSVGGGLLTVNTLSVDSNAAYFVDTGGALGHEYGLVMEMRTRVRALAGTYAPCRLAMVLMAWDGVSVYAADLTETGVYIGSDFEGLGGTLVAHPVEDGLFHTYRLESPVSSTKMDLWIDGVYRGTALAPASSDAQQAAFGDSVNQVCDVDADIDYVLFATAIVFSDDFESSDTSSWASSSP